jgi:hypothetical protein
MHLRTWLADTHTILEKARDTLAVPAVSEVLKLKSRATAGITMAMKAAPDHVEQFCTSDAHFTGLVRFDSLVRAQSMEALNKSQRDRIMVLQSRCKRSRTSSASDDEENGHEDGDDESIEGAEDPSRPLLRRLIKLSPEATEVIETTAIGWKVRPRKLLLLTSTCN